MKVVPPASLTLIESSVSESDAVDSPLWSASTTYAAGDRVRRDHVRYESLISGNVGKDPAKTSLGGLSDAWRTLGATNPYAMLDDFVDTQTEATAPEGEVSLSFAVPFTRCTAFALLNVDAARAEIVITDEDNVPQVNMTFGLVEDIGSLSPFDYLFAEVDSRRSVIVTGLPLYLPGTLRVTLYATERAGIGHVVCGRELDIGWTKWGAGVGETDYSRKSTNDFGVTTLIKRPSAATESLDLYLHPDRADAVKRILTSLRATPALWIADNFGEGTEALTVYGWREDFRLVYAGPNEMQFKLEIQGLI